MLENREEELTTVRVQDPRVQNEGSWNSYVDYKIFLHTNSKAFTAKTSCVRRRYREFVWLRRQLQRNAGLVPVPELPGKSAFFVGSTDEFIERRRQGLQHFLERVPGASRGDASVSLLCPQGGAERGAAVRQPPAPVPAEPAARARHRGLRAGPGPALGHRGHPALRHGRAGLGTARGQRGAGLGAARGQRQRGAARGQLCQPGELPLLG
ncbi:sorting nexin-11 isoform X2 [Camarhynchus parvulus]|uniref:sorting nexin-11 isoform X2 n=1 Tax=Geospiza parvula TaxID=87175 RepID=UPI0012380257|nr:sorting nexin-11 isoform X2 [Camarhynchus parvulus]